MGIKAMDGYTAVGVTAPERVTGAGKVQVEVWFDHYGATPVTAVAFAIQGANTTGEGGSGLISQPNLTVGSTAERVANSAFQYRISNTNYSKAAVAAGSVFSAAHVVSATKFGVVKIYIDTAGNISSKVVSATQAYATAAAAIIAADDVTADPGTIEIGWILIDADAGAWTANTDDLTNGSDLDNAVFNDKVPDYSDVRHYPLSAAELTAQKATFVVDCGHYEWVRGRLSSVTGDIRASMRITPIALGGSKSRIHPDATAKKYTIAAGNLANQIITTHKYVEIIAIVIDQEEDTALINLLDQDGNTYNFILECDTKGRQQYNFLVDNGLEVTVTNATVALHAHIMYREISLADFQNAN